MADDWIKTTLGEFITLQRGFDLPAVDRIPGQYPVIASTGPVGTHKEAIVKGPGVVIGRSGSIGGGQYILNDFWPLNTTLWVKDFKGNNPHFCYYFLKSIDFSTYNAGSGVPTLNRNHINLLPIKVPKVAEQKAIVNILGSLDDKIALNLEMDETLEGMARAIFKSWFVDFDPVKAKAAGLETGLPHEIECLFPDRFEDSELEPIPKGWEVALMPEVFYINPKRSLKSGTIAPYLDMKNMPTNSMRPGDCIDREFTSGTKFMNGDTLVARITPCLENGKTAFVDFLKDEDIGWGSTEYIILRSKPMLPLEYSYFFARKESFRNHAITNMTGSSGRQRVPITCFDAYHVVIPPMEISSYFGNFAQNVIKLIKNNDIETNILSSIRDILLPRLISGEIRVPERCEGLG